jgi:hypothetical protein
MNLQNFLSTLFDADDLVNVRILPERKGGAASFDRVLEIHDALRQLNVSRAKCETQLLFPCVGVNPYDVKKKVIAFKNIVVDIDNAPLPAWAHERADMICSRDDMHHHLFFCFAPFGPSDDMRAKYSATVKALLKLTGSKEKAAHDPTRIIRLPTFTHGKTGDALPGYEIVFIRDDIKRIAFNKKFAWLKADAEPAPAKAEPTPPAERSHENSIQYLKNLYLKKPSLSSGDGRSRELFFIGLDAHAWGIPQEQAEALADAVNQKKFSPPETIDVVRHQISSAYRYRRGEFGSLLTSAQGQTERQQTRARMQFEAVQRARDMLCDFVYVHGAERLIHRVTRFELTQVSQINNYVVSRLGEKVTLEELLKAQAIDCADELDFLPGADTLFEKNGRTVFNRYTPPDEPAREPHLRKKAVKVFREHIAYLTTSEAEETKLLQFFAYAFQNPGKKLKWAPLLIGKHTGTGRGALAELVENMAGTQNVGFANSHDLTGQHTDYVADKVFVIVPEVETEDKNVMRSLKSLITDAALRVVAKYARTYQTVNRANFLFFSNRIDALRVDSNDRRLFVIYNRREPRAAEYYDTLYEVVKGGAGWILDYLLTVDLSGFNPHARPGDTEGRTLLTQQSESELAAYLREIEAANDGPFANRIFSTRELLDFVTFNGPDSARRFATQRAVHYWLDGRGFRSHDVHETDARGNRKHTTKWFKGERDEFEKLRKKMKKENGVEHESKAG